MGLVPGLVLGLAACGHGRRPTAAAVAVVPQPTGPAAQRVVISVAEQMMVTFEGGKPRRMFRVSTSRFGTGGKRGTYLTPLGRLEVVEIVGQGLPVGARLKARQHTGEIVPVNAPGRDPIVTRVVRLRGLERHNAWTLERAIYIHGTPEEWKLKTPASYGCIRMGSADIIALCQWLKAGTRVDVVAGKLPAPDKLPE
ncbi:L,D-transpeptidase [Prosthecobacter sp.]|uniref:L,D-transpeptidase n=1 Tax=Prosthecobacter sp. TaxID=1965333 RepID=UPI003782E946